MISSRAVLISSSLRPSRPACHPGLSSRFVVSPGFPVPRLVSRSIVPPGSYRHLVISSCSRVISIAIPSGLAPIHGGEGSDNGRWRRAVFFLVRRFPQLVVIRLVIRLSSSGRRIVSVPHRGGLGVGSSSSHPLGSSHSSPLPNHLISSRNGGVGPVIFQASNDGMTTPRLILSSHHLIPSVMERLVRRLVSCVSSSVSNNTPGTSTSGLGGRSKQTNTQER